MLFFIQTLININFHMTIAIHQLIFHSSNSDQQDLSISLCRLLILLVESFRAKIHDIQNI